MLAVPLFVAVFCAGADAQTKATGGGPDPDLYRTIAAMDAAVFDAYNKCELEKFGSFFTEELEFYHDNGGLTNRTRKSLVEALKNNICHKVRRELVASSLEVYPLHGYGAVEIGVHRFYHPGRDDVETPGEAKFIHLWQNINGEWKITRLISFDHRPLVK